MEYNTPKFRNEEINTRVLNLMYIYTMVYSPVKQLRTTGFPYLTLSHSDWAAPT